MTPRNRPWPDDDLTLPQSVLGFFQLIHTTAVNKLDGLDEQQARATPLATSPVMNPLGLIKHLTAVQRQHIQRTIGGQDLPSLWRSEDHDYEFRIGADETIASVLAAYDAEWERSQATLRAVDWDGLVGVPRPGAGRAAAGRRTAGVGAAPRAPGRDPRAGRRRDRRMIRIGIICG
ncbi:mycothiol transferase [Kribbella sp. WER1]